MENFSEDSGRFDNEQNLEDHSNELNCSISNNADTEAKNVEVQRKHYFKLSILTDFHSLYIRIGIYIYKYNII